MAFSGARIRQARLAAGMTQAALANAANTRERNIVRWENDQHAPRLDHVAAIARATKKDLAFFLEQSDDDEESRAVDIGAAFQSMFDAAVERAVDRRLARVKT